MLGDDVFAPGGADWMVVWPPQWSRDGTAVACHLASHVSPKECIAINGRKGEEFDGVGPPALSRDGRHVAYRAMQSRRFFVVVDGRRGPEFDFVVDPAISADGKIVAYAGQRDGDSFLVVGDRETALDRPASRVFLSDDGRSVGWLRQEGRDGDSKVCVVVNGKAGEAFTLIGRPVFSPDGRRVVYAADDGPRQFIVIGDVKVEVEGRLSDPVFSPDGKKVGYGARVGRQLWWKVLDAP